MPQPDLEEAGKTLAKIVAFLGLLGKGWTAFQAKRGEDEAKAKAALPPPEPAKDPCEDLKVVVDRLKSENERLAHALADEGDRADRATKRATTLQDFIDHWLPADRPARDAKKSINPDDEPPPQGTRRRR